jgi:hypothetical protein
VDRERERELEEARERRFYALLKRTTGTVALALAAATLLAGMTFRFGWEFLFCMLGLLAGLAIAAARASARSRAATALVLGAVTLPLLAGSLGMITVFYPEGLSRYRAVLWPFVAYATAALFVTAGILRLWRAGVQGPAPDAPTAAAGGAS